MALRPGNWDITIYQGTDWHPVLTWKIGVDEVPLQLGSYTARMQVRSRVSASDVLLELTTENGRITLGDDGTEEAHPDRGQILPVLTDEETALIAFRRAVYDMEMVSGGGEVIRLLEGAVRVSPEVTRPVSP